MTKQQNKTQSNNNNKGKKIKGKYCSLPLPLCNPIRTDFISSLSVLPRLFFAATTFMPSPLGSPALLYASVPPAPARIWPRRELWLGCVARTHQALGRLIGGKWRCAFLSPQTSSPCALTPPHTGAWAVKQESGLRVAAVLSQLIGHWRCPVSAPSRLPTGHTVGSHRDVHRCRAQPFWEPPRGLASARPLSCEEGSWSFRLSFVLFWNPQKHWVFSVYFHQLPLCTHLRTTVVAGLAQRKGFSCPCLIRRINCAEYDQNERGVVGKGWDILISNVNEWL